MTNDPRLHALTVAGHDDDGTPYRHTWLLHEPVEGAVTCVECHARATYAHPRYPGAELVRSCRGLVLCDAAACAWRHLIRHDRARLAQDQREAEIAAARRRTAA